MNNGEYFHPNWKWLKDMVNKVFYSTNQDHKDIIKCRKNNKYIWYWNLKQMLLKENVWNWKKIIYFLLVKIIYFIFFLVR